MSKLKLSRSAWKLLLTLVLLTIAAILFGRARAQSGALTGVGAAGDSTGMSDADGQMTGWLNGPCFDASVHDGLRLRTDGGSDVLLKKGLHLRLQLRDGWLYYVDASPKPVTGILRYALRRLNLVTGRAETIAPHCFDYCFAGDRIVYRAGYDGFGYERTGLPAPKAERERLGWLYMTDADGGNPVLLLDRYAEYYAADGPRVLFSASPGAERPAMLGCYDTASGAHETFALPEGIHSVHFARIGKELYCCAHSGTESLYYRTVDALLSSATPAAVYGSVPDLWLDGRALRRLSAYVTPLELSIDGFTGCRIKEGYGVYRLEDGYAVTDENGTRLAAVAF